MFRACFDSLLLRAAISGALFCGASELTRAEPLDGLPIIKIYCAGCHGGGKPKADLVLETTSADFAKQAEMWTTVLERVAAGTMPPAGKPQPTAQQRRALADW